MPRRPTRTVPTLVLPAPGFDRPEDWPQWLTAQLAEAGRQTVSCPAPQPDGPQLGDWLHALRGALADLPPDGFDVLAHSLGCLVWLHHAVDPGSSPRPARVALVAPPAVDAAQAAAGWSSFYPVPLQIAEIRKAADGTVLVGSADDPLCPGGVAQVYGAPLKMAATVLAGAGSISADAGFGPWPAVLDWCGRDNLAFIA